MRECLLPFKANEVLAMTIPSIPLDDTLVWNYDKPGEYTVKSGYRFITFYRSTLEGAVGSSKETTIWKGIWKLVVPPKVRVFVWRLCSGALPTMKGLNRRI